MAAARDIGLQSGGTVADLLAKKSLPSLILKNNVAGFVAKVSKLKEVRRDFYEWVRKGSKYDGEFARAEKCLNRYLVSKDTNELRNELSANGVGSEKINEIINDTDSAMKSISVPVDGNNLQPALSHQNSDTVAIKLTRTATCKIPKVQFEKLKNLYLHSTDTPQEEETFLLNIALAHYRYYFLSGGRSGLQDAIPTEVMNYLVSAMDVSVECFASPFNATLPVFCSMFKDSDKSFGSIGSFFDFEPTSGSFEANPPFTESVMSRMQLHIVKLLQNSTGPMTFTVIIPHWTDPVPESVQRLTSSSYFNTSFLIPASDHSYRDGFTFNQTPLFFRDTLVIILTNPLARQKYNSKLSTIADEMKSIWKSASSSDIKRPSESEKSNNLKRPKCGE